MWTLKNIKKNRAKKLFRRCPNYPMIQGYRGAYSSGWYYVLDGTYIAYIYGGFEKIVDVVRV